MLAKVDRTEAELISFGSVLDGDKGLAVLSSLLHRMVVEADRVLEIIDYGISLEEEYALVEVTSRPIDNLAKLILRSPYEGSGDVEARAQAQAWLDGYYRSRFGYGPCAVSKNT